MTFGTTLLLGSLPVSTIVLGMPMRRLHAPAPRVSSCSNAIAIGSCSSCSGTSLGGLSTTDARYRRRTRTGGFGPVIGCGTFHGRHLHRADVAHRLRAVDAAQVERVTRPPSPHPCLPPHRRAMLHQDPVPSLASTSDEPVLPGSRLVPARQLALLIAVGSVPTTSRRSGHSSVAAADDIAARDRLVIGRTFTTRPRVRHRRATPATSTPKAAAASPSWPFLLAIAAVERPRSSAPGSAMASPARRCQSRSSPSLPGACLRHPAARCRCLQGASTGPAGRRTACRTVPSFLTDGIFIAAGVRRLQLPARPDEPAHRDDAARSRHWRTRRPRRPEPPPTSESRARLPGTSIAQAPPSPGRKTSSSSFAPKPGPSSRMTMSTRS